MKRLLEKQIRQDLQKKMVFLTGPRQVGKTWLAQRVAKAAPDSVYLNYDSAGDREIIRSEAWLAKTRLLILDELHKMRGWKNYLKGLYDTRPEGMRILVTGSARLDTLRQGGDSLAGRFFRQRLLPFTPAELRRVGAAVDMDRLLERGGFPEPYLAEAPADADRWRMQYLDGLVRTDILDFERIHDFRAIQMVLDLLRSRTGSPVSYASIAEDVQISPHTVKKYVEILEALFIVFRVTPFSRNIARSILKEPKIYFYDTGLVRGDEGARFENLAATCLLKHAWAEVDLHGQAYALHYIRTKDGREVDFCLVRDHRPELLVEAKRSEPEPSKALTYFHDRYAIPAVQVVLHLKREKASRGVEVRQADRVLADLLA